MTGNVAAAVEADVFAAIAAQRRSSWGRDLIQPQPEPVRAKPFPAMRPGRRIGPARATLDSPEKLERALAKLRRGHAKFLLNHAPELPSCRDAISLDEFDWRLETPADRADFAAVQRGEGEWTRIRLPHFGPPEGRATAYYRTEFELTKSWLARGAIFLRFRGVDYKAHAFLNGAYAGSHEGFFAPFEFDGTAYARAGLNTLVVKVENDAIMMGNFSWDGPSSSTSGDKIYAATGPGYDDPEVGWHHCPPAMGIYQPVSVEARGRVHISDLFVRPLLEKEGAEAWVEVFNCDVTPCAVSLSLSVFGRNFRQVGIRGLRWRPRTVRIPGLSDMPKPGDDALVELAAGPGVNYFKVAFDLPGCRRWTPETPWLYQIQVELLGPGEKRLDLAERQFGMRSFQIDESSTPKGRLLLNGRPIRLRGANTMGFEQLCVMRGQWDRLRDDLLLAKLAHMNFLRLTQRPVQDEVYEWCDRLGIMTQTDLPLFGCLRRNQFLEAVRQAGEMERLIRSHPCNILVSYINEPFPHADGNPCRHLTRAELTDFFRAADIAVRQANPDRAIKPVDGDYDPPAPGLPDSHCYNGWYLAHGIDLGALHKGFWQHVKPGWHYACGEFGAEGLDAVATMRRRYPGSWLPANAADEPNWTPERIKKCQTGSFHYLWFERPDTLAEWVSRSQEHQAWVTRLIAEAFRRDWRMVSFAIHLFIDAFPAGWLKSIVDVDRRPKPAYLAYRDALTPTMLSLRSDRSAFYGGERIQVEAWVCNDRRVALAGSLRYGLKLPGRGWQSNLAPVRISALSSALAGLIPVKLPSVAERTKLTLQAALLDRAGRLIHEASWEFTLFPRPAKPAAQVRLIGRPKGAAARLAEELGLRRAQRAPVILIDDLPALTGRRRDEVAAAVHAGASALVLSLPPGSHEIGGSQLTVAACAMGSRHFASRATAHPAVAGFEAGDFRFWHDGALDRASPFLHAVFRAEGWQPILLSGNPGAGGRWEPALAAAERADGAGRWIVCQLDLAGRIAGNPPAEILARRLIASPQAAG